MQSITLTNYKVYYTSKQTLYLIETTTDMIDVDLMDYIKVYLVTHEKEYICKVMELEHLFLENKSRLKLLIKGDD